MSSNSTLVGKVGRDPELRYSNSGVATCRFSVAVNRRKKAGDEWIEKTTWYDVTTFSDLAENCAESLSKGDEIIVEGYVEEPRTFEKKDGTTGVSLPFVANNLGVSLRWGMAKSVRGERPAKKAAPEPRVANEEPF
jgi:single-strand DNA-binding protein